MSVNGAAESSEEHARLLTPAKLLLSLNSTLLATETMASRRIFPAPGILLEELHDTIKLFSRLMKCNFHPETAALPDKVHALEFTPKPGAGR